MARVQTPSHMRREYECVYLIGQDFDEPVVDKVVERYRDLVKEQGGKVVRIDNWGKRRLAYPIEKQGRATYIYMQFLATGGLVAEMERNMRISDEIVRWLTVVIDDAVDPTARPEATEVVKHVAEEEEPRDGRRGDMPPRATAPTPVSTARMAARAEAEDEDSDDDDDEGPRPAPRGARPVRAIDEED